jgi:hypothetical protein
LYADLHSTCLKQMRCRNVGSGTEVRRREVLPPHRGSSSPR